VGDDFLDEDFFVVTSFSLQFDFLLDDKCFIEKFNASYSLFDADVVIVLIC